IRDKLVTGVQTCALPILPLDVKVDSEKDTQGYVRKRISYGSRSNGRVDAELFVPRTIRKNAPAMVCSFDDRASVRDEPARLADEIGRASCRERVWVRAVE